MSVSDDSAALAAPTVQRTRKGWARYEWGAMTPFILVHFGVLGALWSGVTWQAVACAVVLYVVRMFAVTGGYHRYFAHRTFKTSRVMQFLLAFVAQTSAQKGALWWAAHHRRHHKYSDQPEDVHSPVQRGFWYSHVGWLYDGTSETDWARIGDFAQYPELRLLNRFWLVPPFLMGFLVWLWLGWSGLFIGFFLSTVLVWHSTFLVNSLTHVVGRKRFATGDESRNSWWIALVTFGEGWHNNHHYYQSCTRQGFYWWELDITYYVLKAMSWVGLVWDLREPPGRILAEGRERDRAKRRPARGSAEEDAAPAGQSVVD